MRGVVVLESSVPTNVVTSTTATNASATATFPLMTKLLQKKAIASALELPSSAIGDDVKVMITGKLQELDHNPVSMCPSGSH